MKKNICSKQWLQWRIVSGKSYFTQLVRFITIWLSNYVLLIISKTEQFTVFFEKYNMVTMTLDILPSFTSKEINQPSAQWVTCNLATANTLSRSYIPKTIQNLPLWLALILWGMKQLSKRTFILAGLQLQSGGQAGMQQQASSPQAPVDRIRLLCSRLLLLLRENEKVAPAAWQGAQSPPTHTQMITDGQAHMHVWTVHTTTHVHTCTNTCWLSQYRYINHIHTSACH